MNRIQKKRHHYVPVAYLNRFTDATGRLYAYRKDDPRHPLHVRPNEIAFEKYYYSQPLPGGGQDNNLLEDLFSTVETWWPGLVNDLTAKRDTRDRMEILFQFMGLLRVRGPMMRDAVELQLAQVARRTMLDLAAAGELLPPPGDLTFDDIEISIDPHQSIHAMVPMLEGFGRLAQFFGLEVVHNTSRESFVTSDNPVVIFDPDVAESAILPYTVRPPVGRVELLLPISHAVALRGRSELPPIFPGDQPGHVEMASPAEVRRVNRFVARFAYRFVFANHPELGRLVARHAALSPTVRFNEGPAVPEGAYLTTETVFGPRPEKPKWRSNTSNGKRRS